MGALIVFAIIAVLSVIGTLAASFGADSRILTIDPRYPTDGPGLA